MPAIGDIYEVVDSSTMLGQKVLNVYFYRLSALPVGFTGASDVAQGFVDQVLPEVRAIQTTDVLHQSVKARNLFDETDAHEILISSPGIGAADSISTFNAFAFRLVGDNAAVRAGAKRIAGVNTTYVTDGVVDDAAQLTALNTLADTIAGIMTFGLGFSLADPTIVKRIADGGGYRLPINAGEAVYSLITDVLFSPLVTSQVSRKVGRGE